MLTLWVQKYLILYDLNGHWRSQNVTFMFIPTWTHVPLDNFLSLFVIYIFYLHYIYLDLKRDCKFSNIAITILNFSLLILVKWSLLVSFSHLCSFLDFSKFIILLCMTVCIHYNRGLALSRGGFRLLAPSCRGVPNLTGVVPTINLQTYWQRADIRLIYCYKSSSQDISLHFLPKHCTYSL